MVLEDFFSASLGLLFYSKEKAEEFIDFLVEKGEMQRDDASKMVNRMVEKGKAEKERYQEQIHQKIDTTIKEKLITKEDFRRLEGKLDELIALVKEKQ